MNGMCCLCHMKDTCCTRAKEWNSVTLEKESNIWRGLNSSFMQLAFVQFMTTTMRRYMVCVLHACDSMNCDGDVTNAVAVLSDETRSVCHVNRVQQVGQVDGTSAASTQKNNILHNTTNTDAKQMQFDDTSQIANVSKALLLGLSTTHGSTQHLLTLTRCINCDLKQVMSVH